MSVLCAAALVAAATPAPATSSPAVAADPLQTLLEGNRRFADGAARHPDQTPARRAAVATGQQPPAVVVGCADSRVPPEVVFDQGLGDVFVVRTAGNVVDEVALGSIEFAVASLGARLIVVLGHERCGAVEAALAGKPVPGHIQAVIDAVQPNISPAARDGGRLDEAIDDNVGAIVARLRTAEPILAPRVRDGSVRVVGAVYDLDSGAVRLVDPQG
jgi:carbonic anhydrase